MLVYLDIDGVVIPDGQHPDRINQAFTRRLLRLADATGAKIVVTSHRRRSPAAVLQLLYDAGIYSDVLHPSRFTDLDIPDLDDDQSIRGQEIARHAARHRIDNYVILDDCTVLPNQAWRHVQTDDRIGLTDTDVDVAISILKGATLNAA